MLALLQKLEVSSAGVMRSGCVTASAVLLLLLLLLLLSGSPCDEAA
jgi:hypothetical protein